MRKKTALSGLLVAAFLAALMTLMPMSGYVQPASEEAGFATADESVEEEDNFFRLPGAIEETDYEFPEEMELVGMRDARSKAFKNGDDIVVVATSSPIHYMDNGVWEEIDLNIKANYNGWEVTENTYEVMFASELEGGISVQANQFVDPIISGINPQIVTLDESGVAPQIFEAPESHKSIEVGGNVIRYPVAQGFSLDYTVETHAVKQNLIIEERPMLDENVAWFGLQEVLAMPIGYGLFLGEIEITGEIVQTDEPLEIRNLETGELLAEMPTPVIIEPGATEPKHATYFVSTHNGMIFLTTAVESEWLMDEERNFPLGLDPTLKLYSADAGYCYRPYSYCYTGYSYMYAYRYYSSFYYMPWSKYTFSTSSQLPSGATVSKVDWKLNFRSNRYKHDVKVLEDCGTAARRSYSVSSKSCTGSNLASTNYVRSIGGTQARKLISSIYNSAKVDDVASGTGWKTATICGASGGTACSASTGTHNLVINAATNGGTVGMGFWNPLSRYSYTYAYSSTGSSNSPYFQITYSGGSDTDPPVADFGEYTGITSYKEGERTFFFTLADGSGIDTTSSGAPHLYYRTSNSSSYTAVKSTSIGTCSSTDTECKFKASTGSISTGDYVSYFFGFQDLNTAGGANFETLPKGGSGSPSSATAPSSPFTFFVDDVANAGNAKKMTILMEDRYAGSAFTPSKYFDQQLTYYEPSDEYVVEFDTSDCGTGSSSCWYTSSYYFYSNWFTQWTTSVTQTSTYSGYPLGGTSSGREVLNQVDGGYLALDAADGPGMNLIFLYDSGNNKMAMVGLGTSTDIEDKLSGGTTAPKSYRYGYSDSYLIDIPSGITGSFGKISWSDGSGTGGSGHANYACAGATGWVYFFKSTSSAVKCSQGYYYVYSASYKWNGIALGTGYYGRMASTGGVTYKVGKIAPTPDTFAPDVTHASLKDSHSMSRTFTFNIQDAGDPPTGLNTTAKKNEGPTLHWRVVPGNGSATTAWSEEILIPSDTRAVCVTAGCDWTKTLDFKDLGFKRGDEVEYYVTAQDISTANASSSNGNNVYGSASSTNSFEIGDPNKMFIIEWKDTSYSGYAFCSFQVIFYDVTNEIEFQYDPNCKVRYDRGITGYQDDTRKIGTTMRTATMNYLGINGGNPFTSNYRFSTDGNDHAWETFSNGFKELENAQTAISGATSGATASGYYCASTYYWNQNRNGAQAACNANIDLPAGFEFEYFGDTWDGDDSDHRLMIGRTGSVYFKDTPSTAREQSVSTWYTMNPMPYSGNSMSRPGTIAPYWSYYTNYQCYDNSQADCGVYYREMPFMGKGTDISSDITEDRKFDIQDSPVRLNPSGDYMTISANITVQPGVVFQIGTGKGISFDGECDKQLFNGTSDSPIRFEGQNGGTWKGMAFTDDCPTSTDNRHVFKHVDFANTSDAAISMGSRHGASPSTNNNVGNFTMDSVTFSNVKTAISHGSGDGTGITMTNFAISDASASCLDLPKSANARLHTGDIDGCNTAGSASDGAIISDTGSTGGSLWIENVTIADSKVNLIDVDLADVTITNVSVTNSGGSQVGVALSSLAGTDSDVTLYNFDADMYDSVEIRAISSLSMDTVDFGSADFSHVPGGSSSSASGPFGTNNVWSDVTAGEVRITRASPSIMDDIAAGDVYFAGGAPSGSATAGSAWDIGKLDVQDCNWKLNIDDIEIDNEVRTSCGNPTSANKVTLSDANVDVTASVTEVLYARGSDLTFAESTITDGSSNAGLVAKTGADGEVRLIAASYDGDDCADAAGASGDCSVSNAASANIYYGGTATAYVYKMVGSTAIAKADHTVSASLVDPSSITGSSAVTELFTVGSHLTDATGKATVWVMSGDESNGDTYYDHNIRAAGAAGIAEVLVYDSGNNTDPSLHENPYPATGYKWGSSIDLYLKAPPIDIHSNTSDCASLLAGNHWAIDPSNIDVSTSTITFEDRELRFNDDFDLSGCTIKMTGGTIYISSDATNTPTLSLGSGGTLLFEDYVHNAPELRSVLPSYGFNLDFAGGTLRGSNLTIMGIAQDATSGAALLVDDGTIHLDEGSKVYGSSTSSDDMATLKVDGGIMILDEVSVYNTQQTGTGVWVEGSLPDIDTLTVTGAAVGFKSFNAAPDVDGMTLVNNEIGVDVEGGMSLPTLYRSTRLSGMSTGWATYEVDLSGFLNSGSGDHYLQTGWNSIYAGGNAHPRFNYASTKYYMITDRYNIQITDSSGTHNITGAHQNGYYPTSASNASEMVAAGHTGMSYDGGVGGVPSWHCNYYGYDYGPNYPSSLDGYMYYIWRYWPGGPMQYVSYPGYYYAPEEFGFDWVDIPGVTPTGSRAYYPYHFWGFYSPSSYFGGVYKPIEGYNGYGGYYNVCVDQAYSYWMSSGQGARMTFPVVDLSDSSITSVKLFVDVLHNRADNYQDRLEIVARAGSDPSSLGQFTRESGTPNFDSLDITGSEVGVNIGGNFAAADFTNVDVNAPVLAGLHVSGSASATFDSLNVTGGDYGVLFNTGARGRIDITNVDLDDQNKAGMNYLKDIQGDFSGDIDGSLGAAMRFASGTSADREYTGLVLGQYSPNAIGIQADGTGNMVFDDSDFNNDADFSIGGTSSVMFIEGSVDASSVEVTGNGLFERAYELGVTLTSDTSNAVSGADVQLLREDGTVTGTSATDTNGDATGLLFTAETVDDLGHREENLSGYEVRTVAEIAYTSDVADFRYAMEKITLTNGSGNSVSIDLTDKVDARICYYWSSSSYVTVGSGCKAIGSDTDGSSTMYNNAAKTGSQTFTEYGYYGGVPNDMSGNSASDKKVIMVDVPFLYMNGNADNNWNHTTVLATGAYDYYGTQRWYSTSPYGGKLHMHESEVMGMAVNPNDQTRMGVQIGYFYGTYLMPDIQNTTIDGLATIQSGHGYKYSWGNYKWHAHTFTLKNNDITHFRTTDASGATNYEDMCVATSSENVTIVGNTWTNCGVGAYLTRTSYSYQHTQAFWGADDAIISDNTYDDTTMIDIWFALNSHTDGAVVDNNDFVGRTLNRYHVYTQDATTTDLAITNNVMTHSQKPVYMRGALDWNITGNDITGDGEAANPGIYALNGYGVISDNTLVDADGGILIDGIKFGQTAEVTDNTIGSSAGRFATSAVGIWAEDCGSSLLKTGGNSIKVVENALVADGCDVEDTGSILRTTGADSGSVYTVNIFANTFTPTDTVISVGDSVRWRAKEYWVDSTNNNATTPHEVESCNDDAAGNPIWTSGIINLGSTFNKRFDQVGDNCFESPVNGMQGWINVTSTTSSGVSTVGLNVLGSNDEITLNGTVIDGFATAIEQTGGELTVKGDADLTGNSFAVWIDDVDFVVDGGSFSANETMGVAVHVEGASSIDITDMDTSGLRGLNSDGVDFRWNGGTSDAHTTLMVEDATGSIENMTWDSTTTQIDAGAFSTITSINNLLDDLKLTLDSTAVIHEGNLLDVDADHLGAEPTNPVGMMIKSNDNSAAPFVSPLFRSGYMSVVDDSMDDWIGNPLNPSDDAMPGNMSGDGTNNFMVTWDAVNLYIGLTGEDLDTDGDLFIYFDTGSGGTNSAYNYTSGTHTLPLAANYMLWAEDGSGSAGATWGLMVDGFSGWTESSSGCSGLNADLGADESEIAIPWDCIGNPVGDVRMVAFVQDENAGSIDTIHPTQTLAGGNTESLTSSMMISLGNGDMSDGTIENYLLIYRSYVGSATAGDAKVYNLMVKTDADCAEDWDTENDIVMSEPRDVGFDILRACPEIGNNLVDIEVSEDSASKSLSLTNKADDEQDCVSDCSSLTWEVTSSAISAESPEDLIDWALNGQSLDVLPEADEFGTYKFHLTVTDSNGLSDSSTITWWVWNVNDKPTICENLATGDCMKVFGVGLGPNVFIENLGGDTADDIGSEPNKAGSMMHDKANEQFASIPANNHTQEYTWSVSTTPADCTAFTVTLSESNTLMMRENTSNEAGGLCEITLNLTDGVDYADEFTFDYAIFPNNEAPIINEWIGPSTDGDTSADSYPVDANGDAVSATENGESTAWTIVLVEDEPDENKLKIDFSSMKSDPDHALDELYWSVDKIVNDGDVMCDYEDFFTIDVQGDDLVFDLVKDATTNAPDHEIDFLNNNGKHQNAGSDESYCSIEITLWDSVARPDDKPNYDGMTVNGVEYENPYVQLSTTRQIDVTVDNRPELTPDYYIDSVTGFNFNEVTDVLGGSMIPTTVNIGHAGDGGTYNHDYMLNVSFHSNGNHTTNMGYKHIAPPEYGETMPFTDHVMLDDTTTMFWVELDVLTCKDETCDMSKSEEERYVSNDPPAHRCINSDGVVDDDPWSCPGQFAPTSDRRPYLEDKNWCNNWMSNQSSTSALTCNQEAYYGVGAQKLGHTNQSLPRTVVIGGAADVPSFAPGLIAVTAAGLFVSALTLSSRREDDEEEMNADAKDLVDDEMAVSPVIATILMVAVTVVLSGVVYTWASTLAATGDTKGVPRLIFDIEAIDGSDVDEGHWRIMMQNAPQDMSIAGLKISVNWVNESGGINTFSADVYDVTVYGYTPKNSDSFVTFYDQVGVGSDGEITSSYGVGDQIQVKTHDPAGSPMSDVSITITYAPPGGQGAVLKSYSGLQWNKGA